MEMIKRHLMQLLNFLMFSRVRFVLLALIIATNVTACMKPSTRATDPNANFSDQSKSGVNQPAATYNITSDITGSAVVSKNGEGFSIATIKALSKGFRSRAGVAGTMR